jgi:hypothetical protein
VVAGATLAAALAVVALAAAPTAAQQSASGSSAPMLHRPLDLQPPAADLIPPPAGPRLAAPGQNAGCAPAWPCRLRLFGFTGKYGGVGLKAPALTW